MALTRKFLLAMGIEADKVDEIIEAHTETVDALKKERDTAKTEAQKYEADAKKLPDVQKELDELKDANVDDPYKQKYEDEHKAFEDYKAEITKEKTKATKQNAYKALLKDAKISDKRLDSILKVTDLEKLELDKDGKFKNAEELLKGIKEEWSDFIVTEETHGAGTATPPDGNGGTGNNRTASRAAQLAKQYHAEMYGEKKGD